MLQALRPATPEELKEIAPEADLTFASSVYVLDSESGKTFAVVRQCYEIDPIITKGNDAGRRKLLAMFGLETGFTMLGIPEYYFNIHPEDAEYIALIKKLGAEQVSTEPELRFKKVIKRPNVE
jgi:hypothetical protein